MKKRWYMAILAALLCAALLAGCSCSPASTPAPSSASASAAADDAPPGSPQGLAQSGSDAKDTAPGSSAASSAASSSAAQPAAEPTPDPNQAQSFTGIIDSAGMGVYYVKLDDGLVIEVPQDGLEDSGLTDTMPGVRVTVSYRGTLNGNDTSGITFVSIANS